MTVGTGSIEGEEAGGEGEGLGRLSRPCPEVAEGDSQVSVKMMVDPALPVVKCLDFGHLSVEPLPAFYYCVQQCWCCHRGEQIQEKEFIDIKLSIPKVGIQKISNLLLSSQLHTHT